MKEDLLRAAARALDDQAQGAPETASFTRARVLASLHQSRVRRRTRLAFVLPIAASFAAATAWGTVGERAPTVLRSVAEALGFRAVEPAPAPRTRLRPAPITPAEARKSSEPASSRASTDVLPSSQAIPEPTAPASVVPEVPSTPSRRKSLNSRAEHGARRSFDPAHSLYLSAHTAHFVARDFNRALSDWEAYLAAAPTGRFAPEARYNRALCLARLGRRSEASVALLPFAEAPEGSYRKVEAAAVREALAR